MRGHHIGMMRRALFASFIGLAALVPDVAQAAAGRAGAGRWWPGALPFIGLPPPTPPGPFLLGRFWPRHYGKLAFAWSVLTLAPLAAVYGMPAALAAFVHTVLAEYLSFIVLLFALYVVAGGILVTGEPRGTPLVDPALL